MNAARLKSLFGIVLAAGAVAARGSPCGNPCNDTRQVIAVFPDAAPPADGGVSTTWTPTKAQCDDACNSTSSSSNCRGVYVSAGDGGVVPAIECEGVVCSGSGRRPEGLSPFRAREGSPTQAWLSETTHLEAASIEAFRRLRAELHRHGAPRRLLRAASRARRDEERHTRAMRRLSRAVTSTPSPTPTVAPQRARDLEAIALENAVEGCVHETFSALLAHRQATHAEDRDVRAAMAKIAADETRHAALAWQVDAWLRTRLDRAARDRVDAARAQAAAKLVEQRCLEDARLGLPSAAEARELARRLTSALVPSLTS